MIHRKPITAKDRARALVAQMSTRRAEIASTTALIGTVEALVDANPADAGDVKLISATITTLTSTLIAARQTLETVDLTLDIAILNLVEVPDGPSEG